MTQGQPKFNNTLEAGEYAQRRHAYVSVVLKNCPMWRALVESYALSHIQDDHETIAQYLRRIAEQDFEDGPEGCHFPELLKTLNAYSEKLVTAMLGEVASQSIHDLLTKRSQIVVVDDDSFKQVLDLISSREPLLPHVTWQTIEVRVGPRHDLSGKSAVQVIHEALDAQGWDADVVLKGMRLPLSLPLASGDSPDRPRS